MPTKSILLVEDDDSLRQSLGKLFSQEGFHIKEASSGKEGIERLEKDSADLILLDLYLGDMSGFDFLDETRHEARPPVIVLTAFGNWDIQADLLGCGVVDCLAKPVKREELLRVVSKALAESKADERGKS